MYQRIITHDIKEKFFSGKIIMLLWARQIWKTTLVENILSNYKSTEIISFTGDNNNDRELLSENNLEKIWTYIANKRIIFIDEAQKVPHIWNTLKLLIDRYKADKQIVVTWSSSINLLDQTSEPLTWRKIVYQLFPISTAEIAETYDIRQVENTLDQLLIFWTYPAILNEKNISNKIKLLEELSNSSLYRDILEFQQIRNSQIIIKLLKLLALQIGKEVSMNELAMHLSIDMKTVEKYIDLLEKSFIIFRLAPYFTNKRKELNKANKIFFYDLWIRNSIIWNYNFLENRNDVWELRENFLIIERMKKNAYSHYFWKIYFWRTYNHAEIDFLEEFNGKLYAFEFKRTEKKTKIPTLFSELYPNNDFSIIHKKNFLDFVI